MPGSSEDQRRYGASAKKSRGGSGGVSPGRTFTRVADLIEALEPLALGELHLTPEQFGRYTVLELDAMFDGYLRRREHLEDLFIINCALPTYLGAYGRKAPSYRKLTRHRQKRSYAGRMDEEHAAYWRDILLEEEAKLHEAQSARVKSQDSPVKAE